MLKVKRKAEIISDRLICPQKERKKKEKKKKRCNVGN